MFEMQLVEDVVYCTWDTRRLKTWRKELISSELVKAGANLLKARSQDLLGLDNDDAETSLEDWGAQMLQVTVKDKDAIKRVETRLAELGLTWQSLYAAAFEQKLDQVERIERMLDRAERSRQTALKDVCFIQSTKAALLRRLSDTAVEDLPDNVVVPA